MRRARWPSLALLIAAAACARSTDDWLAELSAPEPFARVLAVTALAEVGGPEELPHVLAALDDPNEDVRAAAGAALARLGDPALATLLSALKPGVSAVDRERVMATLPLLGARVAEPLADALFDGKHGTKAVLSALERLGPQATRPLLPRLITALSSPDAPTRQLAAEAIRAVDPGERDALAALLLAARDPDPQVRTTALEAAIGGLLARMRLGGLARAAAEAQLSTLGDLALHPLAQALRGATPETAREPLDALAAFGPAALGPAFDALNHRSPQHVQRAGALAAAIGPDALPTLLVMLDGSDTRRHLLALVGLGGLDQVSRPVVPRLMDELRTGDPLVRWGAAYALGHIGPTDDAQLRELLDVAATADHVLHEQLAPGLVEALLDRIAARPAEADAWRAALRDLGHDAIPTLQQAATGSGPRAKAAAEALAALR